VAASGAPPAGRSAAGFGASVAAGGVGAAGGFIASEGRGFFSSGLWEGFAASWAGGRVATFGRGFGFGTGFCDPTPGTTFGSARSSSGGGPAPSKSRGGA
jgi:hypothetical protein